MEKLEKFLDEISKKTNGYSQIELARYVYILLGKMVSFDLNYAFGNGKQKRNIYRSITGSIFEYEEILRTGIIVCKSLSNFYAYILRYFGINAKTVLDENSYSGCEHVFNKVTFDDGRVIYLDLYKDLENIQTHFRTEFFGFWDVVIYNELTLIDRKIGYISDENDYADKFISLLKAGLKNLTDLDERVNFILINLDVFQDKTHIKYVERRAYYEKMFNKLLSPDEVKRIRIIDCYQNDAGIMICHIVLIVNVSNKAKKTYIFNSSVNGFEEITRDLLESLVESGLNIYKFTPQQIYSI